jgi:hypothetical protein
MMATSACCSGGNSDASKPTIPTVLPEFGFWKPEGLAQEIQETNTVNREVLVSNTSLQVEGQVPGIFIAARPKRKRLFEMRFAVPKGGLPKRKPFIWIPKSLDEE